LIWLKHLFGERNNKKNAGDFCLSETSLFFSFGIFLFLSPKTWTEFSPKVRLGSVFCVPLRGGSYEHHSLAKPREFARSQTPFVSSLAKPRFLTQGVRRFPFEQVYITRCEAFFNWEVFDRDGCCNIRAPRKASRSEALRAEGAGGALAGGFVRKATC
jgi:hypothetical protein